MRGNSDAPSAPAYPIQQDEETGSIRGSPEGSRNSGQTSTSGHSSSRRSPSAQDFRLAAVRPGHDQGDESLYRDLLRKAHGDEQLARRWLSTICGHGNEDSSDLIAAARAVSFSKGDLDTAALEAGAPEAFFCPISFKIFRDPVMLTTGQTYERRYIERWLSGGSSTCPATGTVLAVPVTLTPNVALRKSIEVWAEKHATWLLGSGGKVKPIPDEEDFARVGRRGEDADLALAIRLQEEEMLVHHGTNAAARADRRRRRRRCSLLAALLYCLTAGQVATFVLALWQNDWQIETLARNPLVGPSEAALRALGSLSTADVIDNRQYWRLITSIFLCSGIIELVLAVITLWTFGLHVSRVLRFPALGVAALYVLPGVVGALVSVNLSAGVPSIGAPAAVCGLIGAALADQIAGSKAYRNHGCTLIMIAVAMAQFTITGLLPLSSDLFFIFGSMVAGALVMCLLPGVEAVQQPLLWRPFQALCTLCLSAMIAVCIVGMFQGAKIGKDCDWCSQVSCVNTKWWSCETDASRAASSCGFAPLSNGTARIDCHSGGSHVISTPYTSAPQGPKLAEICRSACMQGHGAAAPGAAPSAAPVQAGLLI